MRRQGFLATLAAAFFGLEEEALAMNISISIPGDGSALRGTIPVTVVASPLRNLSRVSLEVDGVLLGSDTSDPFVFSWDTTTVPDGQHTLRAEAFYKKRISEAQISVWTANTVEPPPPPPPPPAVGNRGPGYMRWGNGELPTSHIADYDKVLVSWGGASAAGSSAAKKTGVYMSMVSCKSGAGGQYHFGVTAEELRANNWGMKTASGQELVNTAFGNVPLGDPGINAYALKWAQNVGALLDQWGLDGVFIDDLQRNYKMISGGTECVKYPGPGNAPIPAWESAVASMCKIVYDYLHARGKFVIWNAQYYIGGYAPSDTSQGALEFWPKIIDYCDGLMSEYWLTFGWPPTTLRGTTNGLGWLDALKIPAYVESKGKEFCCVWGGTDQAGAQYIILSMLLEHKGILYAIELGTNQWISIYDLLETLGPSAGLKAQNGNRYERQFQGGKIWVDPTNITSGVY